MTILGTSSIFPRGFPLAGDWAYSNRPFQNSSSIPVMTDGCRCLAAASARGGGANVLNNFQPRTIISNEMAYQY